LDWIRVNKSVDRFEVGWSCVVVLQATDCEPQVIWLSGLHVPESYLTALVQASCRKNGWPLDKSTLYTTVTTYAEPDDVTERIHQGNNN